MIIASQKSYYHKIPSNITAVFTALTMIILGSATTILAQKESDDLNGPFTRLFDTGSAIVKPLTGEVLATRPGWLMLEEDTQHQFKGDAVFLNDRLVVLLPKGGSGAQIYTRIGSMVQPRVQLVPAESAGEVPPKLTSVEIVQNTQDTVAVKAVFRDAAGKYLQLGYELAMGQIFVKTESLANVSALRIQSPSRFIVLPDFFSDDIIIDAAELTVSRAELPCDNFFLHLLPGEQAIIMAIWKGFKDDVLITLEGDEGTRWIKESFITYPEEGKIWIAALAAEGIWHMREVGMDDAGKIIKLNWRQPYPAQWRVDWRRDDHLTDSWEMICEQPNGQFIKPGWLNNREDDPDHDRSPGAFRMKNDRRRFTYKLQWFFYPCWIDKNGQGYFQPLMAAKPIQFRGPALIYPLNRLELTPLEDFTVADLMRATLGVGPCEYILDMEGQKYTWKGLATCTAKARLDEIYEKKLQKKKKADIEKILDDVQLFNEFIRKRIEEYIRFKGEMTAYLEMKKQAQPEPAEFFSALQDIMRQMDESIDKRKEKIHTPGYNQQIINEFRSQLVDYEGEDALSRCQDLTAKLVEIGGNQDSLVGECRLVVRRLRQAATLAAAQDPNVAETTREIRNLTQQILRNPVTVEAPRN